LERALHATPGIVSAEILNAGVRGYTNYQELRYLRKYGVALEPDLVGVAFVLNDLHRVLTRFKVVDGRIVGPSSTFSNEAVQSVESPLYRLARESLFLVWLRRQLSIFDKLLELYARDGYTFELRPDFGTAWQPERWHEIESQLRSMVDLGATYGFRLFLIAFPFGEQFRSDYLERDREYVMFPQTRLAEIATRLGIPYLDLYQYLDRKEHLEPDGIHLTKAGRELAGDVVARFLVDQRLVPPADAPVTPSNRFRD
jgi:lysophospholipase L1-like esterase